MSERFGNTKYSTIVRDFNALRTAIRAYDPIATENAWDKCEQWLEAIPNAPQPLIGAEK